MLPLHVRAPVTIHHAVDSYFVTRALSDVTGGGTRPRAGTQCPVRIIAIGALARRLHGYERGGPAMEHMLRLNTSELLRGLRAGGSVWTRRGIRMVLASALVLAAGIAGAAEHPSPDARSSRTITVIDRGLLSPEAVTIGHGEALEFANYSSEVIELQFIEPKDRADDVHCQVTGNPDATAGSDPRGRWPIFANGPTHHLTVTIPPGRYTTACSFAPGQYGFVTKRVGRDLRSPVDELGQKGAITVE
jgi:hypothetical protein